MRDFGSDPHRGEAAIIRASVALRLGKRICALAAFSDARGYLYGAVSVCHAAELEIQQAIFALNEADLETAEHCAHNALEVGQLHERITARSILAMIEAANDRFRSQLDLSLESLTELQGTERYFYLLATTLRNVALLAQQQDRADLFPRLVQIAKTVPWNHSLRESESQVYRELGLLASRFGDHLSAFRFLRRSAEVAPNDLLKLEAVLDGAAVAREINEFVTSADRLANAEELAAAIDWDKLTVIQRLPMFALAEELARTNSSKARQTLDLMLRLNRREANNVGPAADIRYKAVALRAIGIVAKNEGNVRQAQESLQQAFSYWRSAGFGWVAATTALELLHLTGDACYERFLQDYVAATPSVHLRRQLDAVRLSLMDSVS